MYSLPVSSTVSTERQIGIRHPVRQQTDQDLQLTVVGFHKDPETQSAAWQEVRDDMEILGHVIVVK